MTSRDPKDLSVMIVEDESMILMLVEDMLADMGCTVAGVASVEEDALTKIATTRFDAAILDINLNGVRSERIAEKLRERRIPFVLSTGYGASVDAPAFRGAPILAKPFQETDLRAALSAAIDADRINAAAPSALTP